MLEQSIEHLTYYETNTTKENHGINFENKDGLKGFVWHENNAYLFWGFYKSSMEDAQKIILQNLQENDQICEQDDYWWNDFQFSDGEYLWLKDFTLEKTFNLIKPERRQETVEKIVEDILNFIDEKMNKK